MMSHDCWKLNLIQHSAEAHTASVSSVQTPQLPDTAVISEIGSRVCQHTCLVAATRAHVHSSFYVFQGFITPTVSQRVRRWTQACT
jgi:hypothetical protein